MVRLVFALSLAACCASPPGVTANELPPDDHPARGRFTPAVDVCVVSGQALTGPNRPAKGTTAIVLGHQYDSSMHPTLPCVELGRATADAEGRFAVSFRPLVPASHRVCLMADGFATELKLFETDKREVKVEAITLKPEQLVAGRVLAPGGNPAGGVNVEVAAVQIEGIHVPLGKPITGSAWPIRAESDEAGRVVLRGVPAGAQELWLRVDDDRYAPVSVVRFLGETARANAGVVVLDPKKPGFELKLEAPRWVTGRVVREHTGKPLAGAWVGAVMANWSTPGDSHTGAVWAKADADGRFKVRSGPWGPNLCVYAFAPPGEPCPDWSVGPIEWDEKKSSHDVTIAMPTGTLIRGRVIEEGTGRPVAGASLISMLHRENPKTMSQDDARCIYWSNEYHRRYSAADGTFEQPVASGELSHIMVKAPDGNYISRITTIGDMGYDKPGGAWMSLEAAEPVTPRADQRALEMTITLKRGVTLRGVATGPNGEAAKRVLVYRDRPWHTQDNQAIGPVLWGEPVPDGQFAVPGCDPKAATTLYFLDAENQWGATVVREANAPTEAIKVTLQPCGSAKVRVLTGAKKPLTEFPVYAFPRLEMALVFREALTNTIFTTGFYHLQVDGGALDYTRYPKLAADANGVVVFPTLIPGAPYRLMLNNGQPYGPDYKPVEKKLTVKPSETVDLGEMILPGAK